MKTGFIYPPCDPTTPVNLLVNSDFCIAQAGYGGTHGNKRYAADRWQYNGQAGQVAMGDGLIFPGGFVIYQAIEGVNLADGQTRTLGVCTAEGEIGTCILRAGYTALGNTGYSGTYDTGYACYIMRNGASAGIKWAALYEGVYTADTLPPYVPPDPDLELLKCQKYFWQVKFDQYETIGFGYEGPAYAFVQLSPPVQMRMKYPTLTQSGAIQLGNRAIERFANVNCNGTTIILGINYPRVSNNVGAVYGYSSAADGVTIALSADL